MSFSEGSTTHLTLGHPEELLPRSKMHRLIPFLVLIGFLLGGCQIGYTSPYVLHTVHESTFDRVFDNAHLVATVFGEGRYALVSDQHGETNQRLYLVDLALARERALDLPDGVPLLLVELINGGDVALGIFWDSSTMANKVVYRIDSDGGVQPLQYLQCLGRFGSDEPDDSSDDVPGLLADGQLHDLTRIEREICKWDTDTGTYQAAGLGPEAYYFNQHYLVTTNLQAMIQALDEQSTTTVTDRCIDRVDPTWAGIRVVLKRLLTPDAAQSDLEARILLADLYRGDEFLWRYEFDLETEYYYWAGIVGERLYFVGNYVKYMELGSLMMGEE
jgi:hypothetical protein